jgi:hypothetical protein
MSTTHHLTSPGLGLLTEAMHSFLASLGAGDFTLISWINPSATALHFSFSELDSQRCRDQSVHHIEQRCGTVSGAISDRASM